MRFDNRDSTDSVTEMDAANRCSLTRKLILRDLNSTNGTFVNGNRISEPVSLSNNDLIQFASTLFGIRHREANFCMQTIQEDSLSDAQSLIQFDILMNERAVTPHFQPIVNIRNGELIGYEILGRSSLKLLANPGDMFRIAAKLKREIDLSVTLRETGLVAGHRMHSRPEFFFRFATMTNLFFTSEIDSC